MGRATSTQTPLQDLNGIITPSDLHFERHHAGVPAIDPERYSLLIHGMVQRPMVFTLSDLKRFPGRSIIRFLECSGNGGRAYRREAQDAEVTPQQIDGLDEHQRVDRRAAGDAVPRGRGVAQGHVVPRRSAWTRPCMTRSIPIDKAYDDAMIAYGQNGEALRPEQGYPARLLLPGFEGSSNVKWIRRIELADRPFMTREETRSTPIRCPTAPRGYSAS